MDTETFRGTTPPAQQVRADAEAVMDALQGGGVAIIPLTVAYAIVGATPDAIRRIFDAKERSYDKPSGMFANITLSDAIHILEPDKQRIARRLLAEVDLPFSIVAPFRHDHPLIAKVDGFVLASSSLAGTLDMLLNAGPFHDAMANLALERRHLVFGSSANTSLTGSKYTLADIDPAVRAAADIAFDYGRSKYANDQGRSSTIIDFRDWTVVRIGVEYAALAAGFKDITGVDLIVTERTAGQ